MMFLGYPCAFLDGTDDLDYIQSSFGTEDNKVKRQQDYFQLLYNILRQNCLKT
jgi:hypothetical protein